jgi:hypothetical protein
VEKKRRKGRGEKYRMSSPFGGEKKKRMFLLKKKGVINVAIT